MGYGTDWNNRLLNALWGFGEEYPRLVPGSKQPGADLLKGTVGQIVGQKVDYYVLVNIFGFRDIVQALGGLHMRVPYPIYYGKQCHKNRRTGRPEDCLVVRAGARKLTGEEVLWYSRAREPFYDDYQRMQRQRCAIGGIARQASPKKVLVRFQQLASATKKVISTDVPASLLPHLLEVGAKAKTARIDSVAFTNEVINTVHPDYPKIRKIAADAVATSERAGPTGSKAPAGSKPAAASGGTRPAKSQPIGSVDDVCQYS
jgi:LCP family protein required for cell wall assembly